MGKGNINGICNFRGPENLGKSCKVCTCLSILNNVCLFAVDILYIIDYGNQAEKIYKKILDKSNQNPENIAQIEIRLQYGHAAAGVIKILRFAVLAILCCGLKKKQGTLLMWYIHGDVTIALLEFILWVVYTILGGSIIYEGMFPNLGSMCTILVTTLAAVRYRNYLLYLEIVQHGHGPLQQGFAIPPDPEQVDVNSDKKETTIDAIPGADQNASSS